MNQAITLVGSATRQAPDVLNLAALKIRIKGPIRTANTQIPAQRSA